MRKALWIIPGLMIAGACSANGRQAADSGDTSPGQRQFQVGAFQAIDLAGTPDVIVAVGSAPSVRAEGPRDALAQLDILVEDGTLKIGPRREGWFSHGHDLGHVIVHVTVPSLNAASLTGTGDMRIDQAQASAFTAAVTGTGDLEIGTLRARQASFSITGTGSVRAAGNADHARISLTGSGDVRLDDLQTGDASVSLLGTGDVSLRASGAVTGSIMGTGDVNVRGTTRCTVSKMGPGDLHCTA